VTRYQKECECPQCGCGPKDLKPEALPIIVRQFGNNTELRCDICGNFWIVKEGL